MSNFNKPEKEKLKNHTIFVICGVTALVGLGLLMLFFLLYHGLPRNFKNQWGLSNSGQTISGIRGIHGLDINARAAWKITKGSSQIVIGLLDTGFAIADPNISGSVFANENEIVNGIDDDNNGYIDDIHGWDFYNNTNKVFDSSLHDYHGTNLASIIVGSHENGKIAGVAPDIKLLPLKFMQGTSGSIKDASVAIGYASTMGVKVINCSWDTMQYNKELETTIATHPEILFICSAGNHKNDLAKKPCYPACFTLPNVICVAAIQNDGKLYEFSGYGKKVHIFAPGVKILAMFPGGKCDYVEGASVATAYVSGIAGLVLSVNPGLTSIELAEILIEGSVKRKGKANSTSIIDAAKCIEIAKSKMKGV